MLVGLKVARTIGRAPVEWIDGDASKNQIGIECLIKYGSYLKKIELEEQKL